VRIAGAALLLALALATLAIAPGGGQTGDGGGPPPASQGLRRWETSTLLEFAPGALWWVDTRCRTGKVLFSEGRVARGGGDYCNVWPSPNGRFALATETDPDAPSIPGRLVVLDRTLGRRALTPIRGDEVRPPVTWSVSGTSAAVCVDRLDGELETVMVDGDGVIRSSLRGRCNPLWDEGGIFATTSRDRLFMHDEVFIRRELAASVGAHEGEYGIPAMAAAQTMMLVSVAHVSGTDVHGPGAVVLFDRASSTTTAVDVTHGGYASELGIAPDGHAFWYRGGTTGDVTMVRNGGLMPSSGPLVARAYSWSPSGRLLAVALNGRIEIYDLPSGRHVTIDDVDPARVSWTL
jgi:hypothetical protein